MNTRVKIVSIEGNIGSGKSTVVSELKHFYKDLDETDIYFLEEPVGEWIQIKDNMGKNIIEKFYENQEKYSFSFQMMAYISRLSMLKRAVKYCIHNKISLIICERSLQTDKNVFCKMLYDLGKIEDIEYQIYTKWFDEFIEDIPLTNIIYIKTEPDIAFERVIKRNRKGESICLDYLKMCSDYHDNWLNLSDNIIVDGNNSQDMTFIIVNNFVNKLLND